MLISLAESDVSIAYSITEGAALTGLGIVRTFFAAWLTWTDHAVHLGTKWTQSYLRKPSRAIGTRTTSLKGKKAFQGLLRFFGIQCRILVTRSSCTTREIILVA